MTGKEIFLILFHLHIILPSMDSAKLIEPFLYWRAFRLLTSFCCCEHLCEHFVYIPLSKDILAHMSLWSCGWKGLHLNFLFMLAIALPRSEASLYSHLRWMRCPFPYALNNSGFSQSLESLPISWIRNGSTRLLFHWLLGRYFHVPLVSEACSWAGIGCTC